MSDYWVVTSDVRKASAFDVEREEPLDLYDRCRDYHRSKRGAPVNGAVNRTFSSWTRTATGSQYPSTQKAISKFATDSPS